jgi:hypothetical protein
LDLLNVIYKHNEDLIDVWTFFNFCSDSETEILESITKTYKYHDNFFKDENSYLLNFFFYVIEIEDLKILEWLYSKNSIKLESTLYSYSISVNSIKCFKWLYLKNCEWNSLVYMHNTDTEFISFANEKKSLHSLKI